MILKSKIGVIVLGLLMLLSACGPNVVFEEAIEIGELGWHKDSVAVFRSNITNKETSYHLLLQPEVNLDYAYNNVWFFIDAISPSGHAHRDTIDCYLSANDGSMYGSKKWFTDSYLSMQPYKINIKFPETGTYTYYVSQAMRDSIIIGINSVGLKILEVE